MYEKIAALALLAASIATAAETSSRWNSVWNVQNFDNLIAFGDSYTDESRLSYFYSHDGDAPPAGLLLPESFNTASGGRTWPRYVVQYTGTGNAANGTWKPKLELYDYAVSGAVCSNYITPRIPMADFTFPSVLEYEVSAFKADQRVNRNGTNVPFFSSALSPTNSVYSLWIGTNDLGVGAFLTNSQVNGKVLTDYTDCVYQVFDQLYAAGARVFVLMNTAPLQLSPLYANSTLYGTTADNATYWPAKPANSTTVAETIHEYTTTVNNVFTYQTAFETLISRRYPSSSFAMFDIWSLMSDIYNDPTSYFNGTQPADVTSSERQCNGNGTVCSFAYNRTSSDSFMWYDTLHPSEQTDRIIAANFVDVLNGRSRYATYY